MPISAGVHRGLVVGEISCSESDGGGCLLELDIETEIYEVHRPAVGILALGGVGGLLTVIAPLFPALLPLLPVALLMLFLAWFLVLSQLRHRNLKDFFDQISRATGTAMADGPAAK